METEAFSDINSLFLLINNIESSKCLSDITEIIRYQIPKTIQYREIALYLIEKEKQKVIEKITFNYNKEEIQYHINKIENSVSSPISNGSTSNTLKICKTVFFRYGPQNQESNYESYFVFSKTNKFGTVRDMNLIELLSPHFHAAIVNIRCKKKQGTSRISYLSPRENEVLQWISEGKTNSEIGLILGISSFTVKNHVSNILGKLDVVNRVSALKKLQEHHE